ncbi:MAG: hypothetical protein O6909_08965, partial [Alphaproteobacteria bacterium]|nr:hypothetical protein [Alphaproteobacteria bacterium]
MAFELAESIGGFIRCEYSGFFTLRGRRANDNRNVARDYLNLRRVAERGSQYTVRVMDAAGRKVA